MVIIYIWKTCNWQFVRYHNKIVFPSKRPFGFVSFGYKENSSKVYYIFTEDLYNRWFCFY